MRTMSTSLARCSPGQRDAFEALALEGMKLFERHGATHTRLLAPLSAGQASDVYALTNEFDDAEQYGAFVDELYRDAEFQNLMSRITQPDSPVTIISRTIEVEVPLMRSGPADHGAIVVARIGRVEPGRFEECCDFACDVFEFVEAHGASNCHLLQLDSAGARTGELLARWEFDSARSHGKAVDAWGSDSGGQALAARLRSKDGPVVVTWSGLYRDLHM
jgi:hypothetical protein